MDVFAKVMRNATGLISVSRGPGFHARIIRLPSRVLSNLRANTSITRGNYYLAIARVGNGRIDFSLVGRALHVAGLNSLGIKS